VRTVVVVQARTGSSRLPGKVLLPALGRTLLELQIERLHACAHRFDIVVATTLSPAEVGIFEAAARAGVPCLPGHPTDLLERHHAAGRSFRADVVVKIPSDCPLIDPAAVDRVLSAFHERAGNIDFVSNLHPATYPDGNDVEVMTMDALDIARNEAKRAFEREHTTPFIWNQPERFRLANVTCETGRDLSMTHRLTLDYPEDYTLIRQIFERLYCRPGHVFSLAAILGLLDSDPALAATNARYRGVNWYRHHLNELTQVSPSETRVEDV